VVSELRCHHLQLQLSSIPAALLLYAHSWKYGFLLRLSQANVLLLLRRCQVQVKKSKYLMLEDGDGANTAIHEILNASISLISKRVYTIFTVRRRQFTQHLGDIGDAKHLSPPFKILHPFNLPFITMTHYNRSSWGLGFIHILSQSSGASAASELIYLSIKQGTRSLSLSLIEALQIYTLLCDNGLVWRVRTVSTFHVVPR